MAAWSDRFMPDEYVASVFDVDLDRLRRDGRKLLLCDLDNTLVPWNDPDVPSRLQHWLAAAHARGFTVCILSNNRGPRVQAFSAKSGVPYIAPARKPRSAAFRQAMARFGAQPAETVMIGDQLFTDIQGGKRCGLYTVLVLPLHPREWWGTRLLRAAERWLLRRLVKRGLQTPQATGGNPT